MKTFTRMVAVVLATALASVCATQESVAAPTTTSAAQVPEFVLRAEREVQATMQMLETGGRRLLAVTTPTAVATADGYYAYTACLYRCAAAAMKYLRSYNCRATCQANTNSFL